MMAYPGGILYVSHEREMQELAQFRINMNDVGLRVEKDDNNGWC